MVHCCVLGCKSRSERKYENITFHSFQKDVNIRKLWIEATGRKSWEPTKYTRMCSRHFELHCFRKTQSLTYLYEDSTPTLHINSSLSCKDGTQAEKNMFEAGTSSLLEASSLSCKDGTQAENNMFEAGTSSLVEASSLSCKDGTQAEKNMFEAGTSSLVEASSLSCKDGTQAEKNMFEAGTSSLVEASSLSCKDGTQAEKNMFEAGTSSLVEARHLIDEPSKSSSEIWTPRKKRLFTQLQRKTVIAEARKKKIAALRSKSRRLQKKNVELSAVINTLQSKHLINQETADLLMSDTDDTNFLNPNRSKFSPKVRKFALNLHFISPRAYNFVRKSFNTCLPHTRTLARWYESVDAEPGFSTESLKAVKLLASNTSKKIICGLCFDEMALRKSAQWNGKNYVGFVNCGNQMENDVLSIAKELLVFMLTSLNGSWKLPVGYFLVAGLTADQKASLLKTCIDLVSDCGVDVVSVTFDGCPTNFSMAKLLGCNLEDNEINPVFRHKDKKLVIFPDPCHMLKLVRNTLGDKLLLTDSREQNCELDFF